ncbi:tRNA lysidine(34) synthetase TilS [Vibrio sp. T11.5]|uniref:tRNA lysidine(34) synthetase TilS n=1 Tax=Vibrio sp. T11.5 TaxID=2998836 RepID=UPI0022CD72CE|nr:tRNA lysidine(34) synthetase TilS [Vibrio sp. T11.5]MDA0119493.1 tRNA lysidine(34) synthetase TilS [Vibrio sp. T11.5]
MNLYQIFSSVIDQHRLPSGKLVLALSGGLDSRVLLSLMARYCREHQQEGLVVHVHHGLSSHADDWAKQCQQWCSEDGIPFNLERVTLEKNGKSIEESAREARYQALSQYVSKGDLLLTGQHSDDQFETFLLALKRGSGPKGLSAMAQAMPLSEGLLVRPLLAVSRSDVKAYAVAEQLQWVEDESNQDIRFDRNFIRHQVTPVITQRWPHFSKAVQRSAELCAEQEQLLDQLLVERLAQVLHQDGSLWIEPLQNMTLLMRVRLLRMWLDHHQVRMPSREQLKKMWQEVAISRQDANPELSIAGGQIRRFERRLYLVEQWRELSGWQRSVAIGTRLNLPDLLGTLLLQPSHHGQLSLAKLETGPLSVTFEPQGLSAKPTDRNHSRKLKKLFQEYGVPSWLRRRVPILLCGDRVAAVADVFIDHRFAGQDCELVWDKPAPFVSKLYT